ncbi:MAG: protein-glutamate O-methyltransferase CheR [bacterium]|nr:protein-glutamate O-methyltransferase CheR [bacterium]
MDKKQRNLAKKIETQDLEIQLLLEAIYLKYGYDFRDYARASVKRRILHRMNLSDLQNLAEMQHKVLYDTEFFERLLLDMSINVTEMFRDPLFYRALRTEVLPILGTYPFVKIWHAGCSTGEEAYSMAILLREEGLYERAQIYATDFNDLVLQKAKEGIYPVESVKEYTLNYQRAGGKAAFVDYYTAHHHSIILDRSLKKNIVFANHNLETDGVFGEMHLILCRNVMIYFNRELQDRVIHLFHKSLCRHGILSLGSKESIRFSAHVKHFEDLAADEKIYRKRD